jgi:hypothetical protein
MPRSLGKQVAVPHVGAAVGQPRRSDLRHLRGHGGDRGRGPPVPAGPLLPGWLQRCWSWLAHVHTEVLAQRLHNRYDLPIVLATMAHQRPILEALALSVLLLLLAAFGLLAGLRFTLRC